MLKLIFFVPLVCWLLVAHGIRARIVVGLLLTVVAGLQVLVTGGWILAGGTVTATVGLALLALLVMFCGWIFDLPGAPMRSEPVRAVRSIVGVAASLLWGVLTLLAVLLVAALSVMGLQGVPYPSDDELLPLPAGLVMLRESERQCAGSSDTHCGRMYVIGGSGTVRDTDVPDRLVDQFRARGWSLDYHEDKQQWTQCRSTGWPLDRVHTCVWIDRPKPVAAQTQWDRGAAATVDIENVDRIGG
ncbi:hypothetical protein GPX89_27715 [Nocardia sp. ET3-3]|uniref:Uncharacterized protein n=1 Tax=Nocardia terrae TaxID=2675851 RepID=A0A7K1V345_9NOCA|nr:hypothetical protein [Nocardia terrae]MVU81024.1 hypothetical protein [Nocardia terrae]